jgi:hypothetical protein
MSNASTTPSAARMIRLALVGGVLLFGCVAWYVTRGQTEPTMPADAAAPLTWGFGLLAVGSLAALTMVRRMGARAESLQQRATVAIVGWSLGEAPALLGGVIYLLTGSPIPYLTGVGVMLVALIMVPVPEEH